MRAFNLHLFLGQLLPVAALLLPAPATYYPLVPSETVVQGRGTGATLFDMPIVVTRASDNSIRAFHDGCPHRGASFHGASATPDGGPVCPYHGFEFTGDGVLRSGVGTSCGAARLRVLHCTESDGLVWLSLQGQPSEPPPQRLPVSPISRTIEGVYRMKCDMDVCVSNVLDSAHPSFMHSFGNKEDPEPKNYTVRRLSASSSESTFDYAAGTASASKQLLKAASVSVHNWYEGPSTAVTTVVAGTGTKTVRVRVSPTGSKRCTVFWSLTRDFVTSPLLDWPARYIMEKTLDEDRQVLENLVPGLEQGSMHGTYDKLGLYYRRDLHRHKQP